MAIAPGKTRISITMPDGLLTELHQEAKTAKRTISDVIVSAMLRDRQASDQRYQELKDQLTYLAGAVESMHNEMQTILTQVVTILERAHGSPMEGELPGTGEGATTTPSPPLVTHEEMYGPITPAKASTRPAQTVEPARRKPWSWRG